MDGCPSGELSWWGVILEGSCPVGGCPSCYCYCYYYYYYYHHYYYYYYKEGEENNDENVVSIILIYTCYLHQANHYSTECKFLSRVGTQEFDWNEISYEGLNFSVIVGLVPTTKILTGYLRGGELS